MDTARRWLAPAAWMAIGATLVAALLSPVPTYRIGDAQLPCEACRIIYFHVPSAWIAYLAFLVVFVGSVGYLKTRRASWDALARSSAEVGVVLTSITLATGVLWARPVWGTWWTWDARLTTTLVLWFIYVGYLILRSVVADPGRAARYSAVLGVVGFVDVPINYLSVTWWRTLHPDISVLRAEGPAMPASMVYVLALGLVAFTLLYALLVLERVRLERLQTRLLALADSASGEPAAAWSAKG